MSLTGRSGLGSVALVLFVGLQALASHADTLGGETWTSAVRVRTTAERTGEGQWELEVRVLDRSSGESLLFRSTRAYTGRTKDLSVRGLDQRDYRFSITVNAASLENRLEIRDNGEPVEYVRTVYGSERRVDLAENAASYGANVLRVGGRVLAPELIRRTEPKYPAEARIYRVSGVVVIEATVDQTGHVARSRVVKGLPFGLSEAAQEAVQNWRFKPATMDGKPVPVIHNVTVEFNLHRSGD